MTDIAAENGASAASAKAPKIVAMRDVALGGDRTVYISLTTIVGIAVIAAWAFVFSYALRWLETVLAPWRGKN